MTDQEAKELLQRYENNLCTPEEEVLVESWYLNLSANAEDMAGEPDYAFWNKYINKDLPTKKATSPAVKLVRSFAVAASIVVCLGAGVFIYKSYYAPRHPGAGRDLAIAGNDIKPGSNKAILTLSNGSRITLTDAANGALAQQSGLQITKTANGQITYTLRHLEGGTTERPVSGRSLPTVEMTNTIETPRGGQYQVRLPDGSKVWLNAGSKLTYPVSFYGREERRVELSGEAYFEIAKIMIQSPVGTIATSRGTGPRMIRMPFFVKSKGQEIRVLGTHFNINSYADEASTKTTLLEGSVKVSSSLSNPSSRASTATRDLILKPGQQSTLTNNQIKITEVNTAEAVAWKNGVFQFYRADIKTVMRQLARWYDVEVTYEGNIPNREFTGKIFKNVNASQALNLLKTANVNFRIDGKKIIVTP